MEMRFEREPFVASMSHFLIEGLNRIYRVAERKKSKSLLSIQVLLYFGDDDIFDSDFLAESIVTREMLSSIPADGEFLASLRKILMPVVGIKFEIDGSNLFEVVEKIRTTIVDPNDIRFGDEILESLAGLILSRCWPEEADKDDALNLETIVGNTDFQRINDVFEGISDYFVRNIRYLGPLRLEPNASQSFSPSSEPDDVGPKGEYAAAVFESNRQRIIKWWNPESGTTVEGQLDSAVFTWLRYLGVAERVSVQDAGVSGVAWSVRMPKDSRSRPLSSVGVGISQVLPILIAGLLAPENGLLLIEQPELHLHPSAQAKLAVFFWGLAMTNRRCIVETHSDALINRFRLFLVQSQDGKGIISMYFSKRNDEGDSSFVSLEIDSNGIIRNWPEGFFDESMLLQEQITREAMFKRARK
jgi:hypothetical protein